MNIIVVVSDTFRWDFLGCYGNNWIRTPHLDAFAEQSAVFDKAYSGSFPTVPHRSDLFTGHYCFHTRGWSPLGTTEATFPKLLKRAGYYVKLVTDTSPILSGGKNFHLGFDSWEYINRRDLPEAKKGTKIPCQLEKLRPPQENRAKHYRRLINLGENEQFCARTMRKAAEWLETKDKCDKFMLYVDTFDPHEPWVPPEKYVDIYDAGYEGEVAFHPRYDYSSYLTDDELAHVRALYAATVTLVDKMIGVLLDKIEEFGLLETTTIIFTSDHGFYLGEHGRVGKHTILNPKDGWPLYEEVNHIPLIISVPNIAKGKRFDSLVQPVDIMATILELAKIQTPKDLHGKSILPVLRRDEERTREIAISSGGPHFYPPITEPPPPQMKHAYVLSPDPEYVHHSTVTDGDWTLFYATEGAGAELYNIHADPRQQHNLISENIEVARTLHRKFYDLLKKIGTTKELLEIRKRL